MQYRCWAEVDLSALERNLKVIRAALPEHIRYISVVKADAYGHGAGYIIPRLMQSGADVFAVANVKEAEAINEIGQGWPILVLGPLLPLEYEHLVDANIRITVSSIAEVDRLEEVGRRRGSPVAVHLKIDTGMGRSGVWHEKTVPLYEKIMASRLLRLEGVFTHFSSAESDSAFTAHQRELFWRVLSQLPDVQADGRLIHADNSAGIESFEQEKCYNAVRIGLLQFGVQPYAGSLLEKVPVEPVLSFHSRVSLTKELPAGTGISYGRTYRLKRKSRIAILTSGYGDGIPTSLSNRGQILIGGKHCPILGRVSMDQTIVDVTDHPDCFPGACATIIGKQGDSEIAAPTFSAWANQEIRETFCLITKRVPRIYRTDSGF